MVDQCSECLAQKQSESISSEIDVSSENDEAQATCDHRQQENQAVGGTMRLSQGKTGKVDSKEVGENSRKDGSNCLRSETLLPGRSN